MATADKFEREVEILSSILDDIATPSRQADVPEYTRRVELALSVAKRVRRQSNFLVRELAQTRDELQT